MRRKSKNRLQYKLDAQSRNLDDWVGREMKTIDCSRKRSDYFPNTLGYFGKFFKTVTWVAASAFTIKTPNKRVTIKGCRPVNLCLYRRHLSVQLHPPRAFCSTRELKPAVSVHLQHFWVSWYWSTRQENSANISSDISPYFFQDLLMFLCKRAWQCLRR